MEYGKKVYEIKPNGSWDKGEAVLALIRQVLHLHSNCNTKVWDEEDTTTSLEDRDEEDSSDGNEDTSSFEDREEDSFDGDEVYDGLVKKHQESSRTGPPFYFFLGDDCSDERAFAALKANYPQQSLGILVSSKPRKTEASCWLKDPDEVYDFLNLLLKENHDDVEPHIYKGKECIESMNTSMLNVNVSSTGNLQTPVRSESSAHRTWNRSVN